MRFSTIVLPFIALAGTTVLAAPAPATGLAARDAAPQEVAFAKREAASLDIEARTDLDWLKKLKEKWEKEKKEKEEKEKKEKWEKEKKEKEEKEKKKKEKEEKDKKNKGHY